MEPTTPASAAPGAEPELLYLYATAANGITIGSPLTVPDGYAALVAMSNQPHDVVGPGEYTIDAGSFPRLAQKLQLRPGATAAKRADISVFLFNVTGAVFPWRARPLVTKDTTRGLTYCDLAGRCAARVADPVRFFTALQNGWGRVLKRQNGANKARLAEAAIGKQAEVFAGQVIGEAAGQAISGMGLAPTQYAGASEQIKQAVGSAVAGALGQIGLECTGFEVAGTPQVLRAPCSKCGSATAPTAYGVYRRTISLLYIRLGAMREGNFCVPCATKVWGAYCGVMLVAGWWGIIGLILTPIYLCQNTYYLLKTVFGPKAAAGAVAPEEGSSAWPPAPSDEWGREIQVK